MSQRWSRASGVALVLCTVGWLALAAGCDREASPTSPPTALVHEGSWYAYEPWPHDGDPFESAHFVVYSDSASPEARRELAEIAEGAFADLLSSFDLASTDLHFPTSHQQIDLYAYHDQYPQNWGARSYLGGLIIWSLDHEQRNSGRGNYRAVVRHELTHVLQYLIVGRDPMAGGDQRQVDMWFSEGLAEVVSGGTSGGTIEDLGRLRAMVAEYGEANPIAVHREPDSGWCAEAEGPAAGSSDGGNAGCKDPVAFFEYHYPMFQLAVGYLVDEDGLGRSLADAAAIFVDMSEGESFAEAFGDRMGIGLADYETQFFGLMEAYLPERGSTRLWVLIGVVLVVAGLMGCVTWWVWGRRRPGRAAVG